MTALHTGLAIDVSRRDSGRITSFLPPGDGEGNIPDTPLPDASWINPGNIAGVLLLVATITTVGIAPYVIPFLRAKTFGFAIPAYARIRGVAGQIFLGTVGSDYTQGEVRLAWGSGASIISNNLATGAVLSSDTTLTFGGRGNLWGGALTPTIVNSSDFGIIFKPARSSGVLASVCSVQRMSLKIFWSR